MQLFVRREGKDCPHTGSVHCRTLFRDIQGSFEECHEIQNLVAERSWMKVVPSAYFELVAWQSGDSGS